MIHINIPGNLSMCVFKIWYFGIYCNGDSLKIIQISVAIPVVMY